MTALKHERNTKEESEGKPREPEKGTGTRKKKKNRSHSAISFWKKFDCAASLSIFVEG
jgi:hypothetical protein